MARRRNSNRNASGELSLGHSAQNILGNLLCAVNIDRKDPTFSLLTVPGTSCGWAGIRISVAIQAQPTLLARSHWTWPPLPIAPAANTFARTPYRILISPRAPHRLPGCTSARVFRASCPTSLSASASVPLFTLTGIATNSLHRARPFLYHPFSGRARQSQEFRTNALVTLLGDPTPDLPSRHHERTLSFQTSPFTMTRHNKHRKGG